MALHEKKTTCYTERCEHQRVEFIETIGSLPKDTKIFYADESGFEEYYSRTYGHAPKGKCVYGEVPGVRFGRVSVVGAIDQHNEFMAGFAFKGYMNSDLFCGWLEHIFAPSLINPKKSILIIDNASHHPKDRIKDIADEYGFAVIYLPKYSLDLNPIEKYWANIKNWLRLHFSKYDSFWEGFIGAFGVR